MLVVQLVRYSTTQPVELTTPAQLDKVANTSRFEPKLLPMIPMKQSDSNCRYATHILP